MKIDSLNKRLLAILLILILLTTIIATAVVIYEEFYSPQIMNKPVDVTVDNSVHPLITDYKMPVVLDSTNALYLIPVGQILDSKREETTVEESELLNANSSGYRMRRTVSRQNNNLILKDFIHQKEHVVFNQKVSFDDWHTIEHGESQVIFIKVSKEDSNKDGELNEDDKKSLAIFDVDSLELQLIDQPQLSVQDIFQIHNSSYIGIRCQLDRDKDNKWVYNQDPYVLFQYDLLTRTISPMFESSTTNQAQNILESMPKSVRE